MYRDDCLVFCAKVLSLGEGVGESSSVAPELDDTALLLGHSDTDDWRSACILLLCTDYSRALTVLPIDSARSCPREYITSRRPPHLHQVEHFRITHLLLPITQALPSLRTSHLPIIFTFTCGEQLPAYRAIGPEETHCSCDPREALPIRRATAFQDITSLSS